MSLASQSRGPNPPVSSRLPITLRWIVVTISVGLFVAGLASGPAARVAAKKKVEYNRDIRPILGKCLTCHGNDVKALAAGLRLDSRVAATKALASGHRAIVPGNPAASEMISRIFSKDANVVMPPPQSNKTLSDDEKALLRTWISEGAEYKAHWAFVTPNRPTLPTVRDTTWPRQELDRFVLAEMESVGLKPSPEADRRTLIRRVTLDLTGLPPAQADVDAYLADKRPGAYERVVDRLLASPRYGERMAMDWMDYSRYADSNGYQADYERFQWKWRDWVINAFNRNMPYDQFTVEQLAGDLLPNPTRDQRIATGFNRNHRINTEGGVVAEEWRVETVIDRVETTSTVWLGLTTGCARCHDHKYDPISQKEFYGLFSYFNNVPESGTGEERPINHPPFLKVPSDTQERQLSNLKAELLALTNQIQGRTLENQSKSLQISAESLRPNEAGKLASFSFGVAPSSGMGAAPVYRDKVKPTTSPVGGGALVGGAGYADFGNVADFERTDKFSLSLWLKPQAGGGSPLSRMDAGSDYRGWDLFLVDARPSVHLISKWSQDAIKVVSRDKLPLNQWSHVAVSYDGTSNASGIQIYVNGQRSRLDVERDSLSGSLRTSVSLKAGRRTNADAYEGEVSAIEIYSRVLLPTEAFALANGPRLSAILAKPEGSRTDAEKKELSLRWSEANDAGYRSLIDRKAKAESELQNTENMIQSVMVMEEMPKPRPAYLLIRGQYDKRGPAVPAILPAALARNTKLQPNNRLGLAKWIVAPNNPLTSRVTVNRFWERFFGSGIVETSEDFGTRASFPTHPELLDYLGTELVRTGWNLKQFIREIVTSATYRQSSRVSPALLKRDPTNRYLARGPRFRLQAEVLRDQAMAVGGLLVDKVGGPSVRPYQPDGVWDEVNVYGNLRNYKHDKDSGLRRRSLYTIWKRTAAPPNMTLFDVPSRETCRVRRSRTNTPLQALALLNDVTYVEAARALATRMILEGGPSPESRLRFAYRELLTREPQAAESAILTSRLAKNLAYYRARPEMAKKLIAQGDLPTSERLDASELAAYTLIASTLLNLDETVTRE